ncbi:MAG: winged helix-turn-helix transcriptional regulator [Victivallales bacterium]|nr:winged helix-turn-helix transcriptional regulator [Victivallales bacterium]
MKKRKKTDKRSVTPVSVFKAFGDVNRIQIVERLKEGEHSAVKLLEDLNITQPTLSHHMKILCDAGIVIGHRSGRWTHYTLLSDGVDTIVDYLTDLKLGLNPPAESDAEVG